MNTRLVTILSGTILFCLVFYLYKSSLGYDFVWDDREIIVNNINIRTFGYDSIFWAFTNTLGGHYQPLTWISYIMDYHIWGLESYGYRLNNILIHSTNTVLMMFLIYSFLKLVYKTPASHFILIISSVIGALIFSIHPLRVESVVWLTERRDLLSAFFLLIAFYTYLHYRFKPDLDADNKRVKNNLYIVSFSTFFLSLLCKAWAITFPVVLVLLDIAILRPSVLSFQFILDSIKQKWLYIIMSILFALVGIYAANKSGAMVSWEKLTLMDRVFQASYSFNMYLLHTLYPSNLSPLYLLGKTNFYDVKFYANLVIFISIFVSAFIIRNKYHWPIYILLIYLVIIFPVLGFSQSGPQLMADRYSYIALMPFSIVASWAILKLITLIQNKKKQEIKIIASCFLSAACVITLLLLANNTGKQIKIWENEETLWTRAIQIDKFNYRALNNRASYRAKKKQYKKSFDDYSLSLMINPEDVIALNGRAVSRINVGDLNGAVNDLNKALIISPAYIEALLNRGIAYNNLGNLELAGNDFRKIIEYLPEHEEANYFLGINYFTLNEFNNAITLFTKVNSNNPEHISSIYYRGLSYLYIENYLEAKKNLSYVISNTNKNTVLYEKAQQQLDLLKTP